MSSEEKQKKHSSRRKFLIRAGFGTIGVLAVGTYILRNPLRRQIFQFANSMDLPFQGNTSDPMIWFEITEKNTVILHSPKVEMGQGTFTSLAQMAADELDIDLSQIQVVHAATSTGNIDGMSTGGSTSVSGLWQPLRELAATMREMLKLEAAKQFGVEPASILSKDGLLIHGEQQLTYAEVAVGVEEWEVPKTPVLKNISDYKYVGQPIPRIDLEDKVYGAPIFGMDAEMPEMLYGAVIRPVQVGATLGSVDASKARQMPGVVAIVEEDDFVGVVADSYTEAENAKRTIQVSWEGGSNLQQSDLTALMTVGNGKQAIIQKRGDKLDGDQVIHMEFRSPIGAHAQLEPNGVVVSVDGDNATVILSTQVVGITRQEVADRLDLKADNVNVIPTYLGGGFGRRLHTPHAVQAAVMSKAVSRPVKYFYTRQEEFQHDMFRPPTHHILKGKLTSDGFMEGLEHHFVSGDVANNSALTPKILPSILGADIGAIRGGMIQYSNVPNCRTEYWHVDLPFATSWWRSLGLLANTFAIESFVDEMAIKAEKDAVEFRLQAIADDEAGVRLKNVIRAAAQRAGYREELQEGKAMGFAASVDAGTPCAHVAEVSVEDNIIRVHKVTVAMDPGIAVNPDQVKAQCEGCVIMGISASMFEEMELQNGSLTPTIYGPYRMALMRHTPREIDVVLLQGRDKPGPVGEPPLGPIGAAIGNAVRRLTGKRLTKLPLNLAEV